MTQTYKYLHFISFQSLVNWSVAHLLNRDLGFTKHYPFIRIGDVLCRSALPVTIEDDILYTQVTLKTNGGGAVLRDKKLGKDIGTKKQYLAKEGQFIMSKIDARNGAFGIITKELKGAVVTGDFPLFDVDANKINPTYLYLLSSTQPFVQYAQSCSRGTTNRQRIDIDAFLSLQIPLPSLDEQNNIVAAYNSALAQSALYARQAQAVDSQIEAYLQEKLGIKSSVDANNHIGAKTDTSYTYLHFCNLRDMSDRWDVYNTPNSIFDRLKESPYPIKMIGNVFDFITRSWDKSGETFDYIELGDVDPHKGITEKQTLQVRNAPSRATQIIQKGDLIIGTTRPYLKRFAIVGEEYSNDVCSSGFQIIKPNDKYNLEFLYEYLLTSFAIEQFEYYMTGALYPAITSKDLRKIQIPFPPLVIQNEIVSHISVLRAEQQALQQHSLSLRSDAQHQFTQTIFN